MTQRDTIEAVVDGAKPAASNARIATLDILRGLSLLGMILAHFHKTMGEGAAATAANGAMSGIGWMIKLGVAEKDRVVFAFLFGAGLAIMMRQIEARGQPVVAICLRRLAVLYLLGFAVECLTRFAILRDYAWWGVALLFLRKFPTRTLLFVALISAAALSVRDLVDSTYAVVTVGREQAVAGENLRQQQWEAAKQREQESVDVSDYGEVVAARVRQMARDFPSLATFTPGAYLAAFVLGLLAVRHEIFRNPRQHLRVIKISVVAGLLVWIVSWWLLPLIPEQFFTPRVALRLRSGLGIVDEQYLAFAYIGAITLLLTFRPAWHDRMAAFAWAGRMALTNYVMQAALVDFASEPYGLGLRITPAMVLVGAGLLFGAQVVISRLWLSRFRFGPFEWVWRCLTYWQWQPMTVAAASAGRDFPPGATS